MSRSYRSQKESAIATRRIPRRDDGSAALPRIVERAPARADVHPLAKATLARLLSKLPVEYLYGLSRIELRARQGNEVGKPFASYWKDERAIILYSLPTVWRFRSMSPEFMRSLVKFHADFQFEEEMIVVSWRDNCVMSLWFYCDVFTHELGHHFVRQYQNKNSRIRSRTQEEHVAKLHARRFTDQLFAAHRAK